MRSKIGRLKRVLLPLGFLISVFAVAAGPRVFECANEADAYNRAIAMAVASKAEIAATNGGSMKPFIPARAFLVVKKDFSTAAVDEVLLYRGHTSPYAWEEILLCHRAKARDGAGFIMRGDNNPIAETWQRVTPKNYIGTVVAVFNYPAP